MTFCRNEGGLETCVTLPLLYRLVSGWGWVNPTPRSREDGLEEEAVFPQRGGTAIMVALQEKVVGLPIPDTKSSGIGKAGANLFGKGLVLDEAGSGGKAAKIPLVSPCAGVVR